MREKLKRVRLEKDYLDIEEFTEVIGISPSYYYKIEQGKRSPGIDLAKRIADLLDKTVDEIFLTMNWTFRPVKGDPLLNSTYYICPVSMVVSHK